MQIQTLVGTIKFADNRMLVKSAGCCGYFQFTSLIYDNYDVMSVAYSDNQLVKDGTAWSRRVKVTKAETGVETLRLHWISHDWGRYITFVVISLCAGQINVIILCQVSTGCTVLPTQPGHPTVARRPRLLLGKKHCCSMTQ